MYFSSTYFSQLKQDVPSVRWLSSSGITFEKLWMSFSIRPVRLTVRDVYVGADMSGENLGDSSGCCHRRSTGGSAWCRS